VFAGCSTVQATYEWQAEAGVSRDPVARTFARDARMEAGEGMVARGGQRVRMDAGNRKVLVGPGNQSISESGDAMRVAMDLHAEHGFTHAVATDGSKEGKEMGKTAYGIWMGADLEAWGATKQTGTALLQADEEMERAAVGAGMEGGQPSYRWAHTRPSPAARHRQSRSSYRCGPNIPCGPRPRGRGRRSSPALTARGAQG
jgi:hypothetical protein